MENQWWTKSSFEVIQSLHSSERGLTEEEASLRFKKYGPNKLPEAKAASLAAIFLGQFQSPLIYILVAASAVVFAVGEIIDGSVILAVLFFNAVVGTVQEGRAQNTLIALRKFAETKAVVLRNGKETIIPDAAVVPGDIVILQEGEKVSADARVLVARSLKVDESSFTGESGPVSKFSEILPKSELPIPDQRNMVFKGTPIVSGNGRAIVTATGYETALGKIAKEVARIDTEIPLRANIRSLSRLIMAAVLSVSSVLLFWGIILDKSLKTMFLTAVALSVSIIPEGLPIVITLVLATGVWRMSKQNALIKKLQAVEALGQARLIAVDKTGTLTKNELVTREVYADGKIFEIAGNGYEPRGEVWLAKKAVDAVNHPELLLLGKLAALSSNARIMFSEELKEWRVLGDPTEAAMLAFSQKLGFHKEALDGELPSVAEIPFDYRLKYHASIRGSLSERLLVLAGAPEIILELSLLSREERGRLESVFSRMSEVGLRVVALAYRNDIPEVFDPKNIGSLIFAGFLGMKDTLRPEVKEAVEKTTAAGIRLTVVTGDHKITAEAIAREAGIYKKGDLILTGPEVDKLTDAELSRKIGRVSVFARVTPEHKLRIIKAYKERGEIVAMTGDGVNDAPSLVAADLGVAMGKIGTEVAKEAADIVMLDDNFGSIVFAVEEGRSIYKTIKKVILYLFSTSLGEVLTIAAAMFLGYPLPVLPVQIIWLNFVTDGFLTVALAMEPKEEGLLNSDFERPKKYLIDRLTLQRMLLMALPMMIGTIFIFQRYFSFDLPRALTLSLTTLAVFQWFNAWNCRHESKSIFELNPFSNKFLVMATLFIVFLQIFAVYNPLMQRFLRTTPLTLNEWLIIVPVASSILVVEELRKVFYRKRLLKN
ncbi:HAD-IC family P-type ATPase [Candidatus Wolfebacteria bacterium]|nr:HAD-IC family P-type ATPase [Candidatus Wolfebacteria bacterium]